MTPVPFVSLLATGSLLPTHPNARLPLGQSHTKTHTHTHTQTHTHTRLYTHTHHTHAHTPPHTNTTTHTHRCSSNCLWPMPVLPSIPVVVPCLLLPGQQTPAGAEAGWQSPWPVSSHTLCVASAGTVA